MTSQQAQQLQRAMAIALRDHLTVCGHGTRKVDGATVYTVPSRSEPGRWHLVVIMAGHLECDCHASQRGRICAHRAAVRTYLEALSTPTHNLPESPTRSCRPLGRLRYRLRSDGGS